MGMETILTSWKDGQTETLEKAFNCQEVVMYIIKKKCTRREDMERLIGKLKNTSRYVRRLHAMTTWITYVYREIAPEQMNSIWKHIAQRQFNTVSLKIRLTSYCVNTYYNHSSAQFAIQLSCMFTHQGAHHSFLVRNLHNTDLCVSCYVNTSKQYMTTVTRYVNRKIFIAVV